MRIRTGLLVVLALVLARFDGAAQEERAAKFQVRSDQVKRVAEQVVVATGNVVVEASDWSIRADLLEMHGNSATGVEGVPKLVAEGNVVFERGTERLRLRRLEFEPRTGRGIFQLP